MSISVAERDTDLSGFAGMSPPPADLAPVVEALCERNVQVVTLDDLAAFGTGREPKQVARALRERGWLFPLPVQGAWGVSTANPAIPCRFFHNAESTSECGPRYPCVHRQQICG